MQERKTNFASTALRFANRLVRPLDRLAASDAPGNTAPIMVVGLPRSGTTLAYELLVQAFDVGFLTRIYSYAYGVPNIVTRAVASGTRNPEPRWSSDYGRIPGRYAPAENATVWDRWLPEHPELGHLVPADAITSTASQEAAATLSSMSAIASRLFVFKNVYMTLSLPAFFRLLPNSRVVVVERDMDAIIASVHKRRNANSSWWGIRPPFWNDVRNTDVLEQTAFQCIRSRQLLEHSLAQLPADRYRVVHYSALCAEPMKFIDDMAIWVGDDLERRQGHEIPQQFNPSAGPGLSDEATARRLAKLNDSLDSSGTQYLSRVDTFQ